MPSAPASDQKSALLAVESLRSGIPTRLSTRLLPDARPEVTEKVRSHLERLIAGEPPPGSLIWGAYGQGKTHALTRIEHLALDLGVGVSRVALSRTVSCHNLYTFYARVAAHLRLPDSGIPGVQYLLQQRQRFGDLTKVFRLDRYDHPLPAWIFLDALQTSGLEQETLYGDLVGSAKIPTQEWKRIHRLIYGGSLPPLPGPFKVTQHARAYFGVLADALRAAGYHGWVILIDEVELVGRLGPSARIKAYEHLHWLLNWGQEHPFPIYTLGVVASGLQDIWRGSRRAPHKGDQQRLVEQARHKKGDATATILQNFFEKALDSEQNPVLPPLDPAKVSKLLHQVTLLHGQAYGWDPQMDVDQVMAAVGSQPLRTYIRATLEALDLAFVHRDGAYHIPQVTALPSQDLQEDEDFFAPETA